MKPKYKNPLAVAFGNASVIVSLCLVTEDGEDVSLLGLADYTLLGDVFIMSLLNKKQFYSIDADTRDLVADKSYETLDSGRYMVNVAVSSVYQDLIQTALRKCPDLEKSIIIGKEKHPDGVMILTITQSATWTRFTTIVVKKTKSLTPKESADLLGKLNNATPLKIVPFLVAPQFDWLVNWATAQSGADDLKMPANTANILNGLFRNTEIVVILNIHAGDKPFRISHACISELKIAGDRLVPNFSE